MLYSNLEKIFDKKVCGFSENRMIAQSEEAKNAIFRLQDHLEEEEKSNEGPPTLDKFPVTHHFAPGVYAREMFLPEGHVIIGKIHKHAHLNIISKGLVVVSTEEGAQELEGPITFTSYAGTKRAVLVLKDTIWTTIHVTNETDLDKIEQEIIATDYSELEVKK